MPLFRHSRERGNQLVFEVTFKSTALKLKLNKVKIYSRIRENDGVFNIQSNEVFL